MFRNPRWDGLVDAVESGPSTRRVAVTLAAVGLAGVSFASGLFLRPAVPAPTTVVVAGTPSTMTLNGVTVQGAATMTQIIGDLNALQPIHDDCMSFFSCPSGTGAKYTLQFIYLNGEHWTVVIDRDGCQNVEGGGVWLRTSAASNPRLLRDLDALAPK